MADWMSLLPQAPKPQSASDVYQDAVRMQTLQQTKRQAADYNQARIAETNALAAQHQRVTDVKNGMAKAYADNLKVNPDGTAAVNHVGVLKSMADMGYADETPDILKRAAEERKADLDNLQSKAKYTADKLGGIPRVQQDGWTDPNKVQASSFAAITAINELEREGIITPQDATAQRAAAANYDQRFQGFLDAHSQQAESLHRQFSTAKESIGLHVDQLTADPKIRKAVAEASGAETKATEEQLGLAGRLAGAGASPQSNAGQPPIGGTPTTPQRPAEFETKLTPDEETNFQAWKTKYAPNDSGADYDLRGAFKAGLTPDAATGHWPDTFKKPNHPTFSNESQYAKDMPDKAGHWEGDKFIPPSTRPKDPDWTQEKQDRWDAFRNDPALSRVASKLSPTWSKAAEITAQRLGLSREQQVQADTRANKPEAEDKELKVIGVKLGAAAEQGPAAYTRAFDALTPEQQKLAPNPNQWDPTKTPHQARMLGMTAHEQEPKPSKDKPVPRVQFDRITKDKGTAIANSKKTLDRELAAAGIDTDAKDKAWTDHIDRLKATQSEYEERIEGLTGQPVKHDPWADQRTPPAEPKPKAAPAPSKGVFENLFGSREPAKPVTSQTIKGKTYKVGDTVNTKHGPATVKGFDDKGNIIPEWH